MEYQRLRTNRLAATAALVLAATLPLGPFAELALGKRPVPRFKRLREERFSASILALDLAANSNLAAAALSEGQVHVWRIDTGETVRDLTFPDPDSELKNRREVEPIRVRFSDDGNALAVSHLSRIHIYDATTWQEIAALGIDGEDAVRRRTSPALKSRTTQQVQETDEKTIAQMVQEQETAMIKGDGGTRITDFTFLPGRLAILAAYSRGACFDNPRGFSWCYSSGNDPVRLWELPTGRLLWERNYSSDAVVLKLAASPDGSRFAASSRQPGWCTTQVSDSNSGQRIYSLPSVQYCSEAAPVRFALGGKYLATFAAGPATPKFKPWRHLTLYDAEDGTTVARFKNKFGAYNADVSPDGQWLATPTEHYWTFQIHDVETRRRVALVKQFPWGWTGPPLDLVLFDPDGNFLLVANSALGRVAVYRIAP